MIEFINDHASIIVGFVLGYLISSLHNWYFVNKRINQMFGLDDPEIIAHCKRELDSYKCSKSKGQDHDDSV